MGQVKNFGLEIAELVFENDFDDDEVANNITNRIRTIQPETKLQRIMIRLIRVVNPEYKTWKMRDSKWLRENIHFVRTHPESWNYRHPAYPGYPVDIPEPSEDV